MPRPKLIVAFAVLASLAAAPAAPAATLAVDDDGAQCPAAPYGSIQGAVDAASPGDTVAICPGVYVEGGGGSATNALTITKSLTIKGAGADLVAIEPRRSTPTGGKIAEARMDIRNGVGDVVVARGAPTAPITVDLSGVTVDGGGVFAEAGIVFLDAQGSLVRDRVTHIATSISNTANLLPGGYRSNQFGYGIAQVTAATSAPPGGAPRPLTIDHTRVDGYNKLGVLIDAATGDELPLTPSGVVNAATLESDQIVGRVQCLPFNTPTPPPYVLGGEGETPEEELPGNCSTVDLTTVGPTFGQDGVRVAGGATAAISDSTISQNLVNGEDAPAYGSAANNENLSQGAGVRLIGAGASSISRSNVTDNAYGVFNATLDGESANSASPLLAEGNWWGLEPSAKANAGPAISPTTNPPYQENPVNGTATPDGAGTTSTAVDFFPFRDASEADPDNGEWPVVYAPLPVADEAPTVTLATDRHDYDRGEPVRMTATASDDFGVTALAFYDGPTLVATVRPPTASAGFTIPADAPCAARTLTVVATDFLGQTASAGAEIAVVGPNGCRETVPSPRPPAVRLVAPPRIAAAGATVGAEASADEARGLRVVRVDFFLGNRRLCSDSAAPYRCEVLPTGADVGTQSLRAVVADSAGQTAADAAPVRVAKFAPAALRLEVRREVVRRRGVTTVVHRLRGRLRLPPRVTPKQGCRSGTVAISVKRGNETVLPSTQVSLGRRCTWRLSLRTPREGAKKFTASAKFGGNAVLKPISTTRGFK